MGWAQALGIQGKTDGLGGPKETLSWQQLRKCLRESFRHYSHKLVLQAEGLKLWMQDRLGWPGITLRPPWLVYLDHPLVLILFVAFHVHLKRRLGVGGEGPQPASAQILPLGRARVSASLGHQLDQGQEPRNKGTPYTPPTSLTSPSSGDSL